MPVALDRVDPDFPLCRDGEDFHAVEHGTSDPEQLADDQDIIGPESIQYSRDLSVASGRSAECRFLDKFDATEILLVGEGKDFGAVLFQILGACGDREGGLKGLDFLLWSLQWGGLSISFWFARDMFSLFPWPDTPQTAASAAVRIDLHNPTSINALPMVPLRYAISRKRTAFFCGLRAGPQTISSPVLPKASLWFQSHQ